MTGRNDACHYVGEMEFHDRDTWYASVTPCRRHFDRSGLRALSDRGGFTLIEIATVLVVLGIMLALAVPRLNFGYYAVRGAASSASSVLVRAQRRAVQAQHNVVVSFDTVGGRLRIHDDANNNGQVDGGEAVSWEPLEDGARLKKGPVPGLLQGNGAVSFRVVSDGLPGVVFYRNGAASEEGVFYLGPTAQDTSASASGDVRAGRIQRSTGRLQWYRFANGQWEMTGA